MIVQGDSIKRMADMPEGSVDAIVTDPPYGLEFMGKEWDAPHKNKAHMRRQRASEMGDPGKSAYLAHSVEYDRDPIKLQAWHEGWSAQALRVLKPGGHLLAFGGTRTFHRLTCALEDAGFEIRDCLMWLYGSGFPKSLDVSKAIDKAAGAEREDVGVRWTRTANEVYGGGGGTNTETRESLPASDAARTWAGWGTALKPAWEPIIVARKPLVGTVAANIQAHGTGALNVDGCRIGAERRFSAPAGNDGTSAASMAPVNVTGYQGRQVEGRWPANLVLDEEAAQMLDEQSGESKSAAGVRRNRNQGHEGWSGGTLRSGDLYSGHEDSGGASRFFFVTKGDPCSASDAASSSSPSSGRGGSVRSDALTASDQSGLSGIAGPVSTENSSHSIRLPRRASRAEVLEAQTSSGLRRLVANRVALFCLPPPSPPVWKTWKGWGASAARDRERAFCTRLKPQRVSATPLLTATNIPRSSP